MAVTFWTSDLAKTVNKRTEKVRYYIKMCDIMRRVTKADYEARIAEGDYSSHKTTKVSAKLVHHKLTINGTYIGL